jgi:hypothetical protein
MSAMAHDQNFQRCAVILAPLSKLVEEDKSATTLMTHKYRGCIVVLSINKSVEPNEEKKVLMSGFDQGFTVNTNKQVFRGNWQYE